MTRIARGRTGQSDASPVSAGRAPTRTDGGARDTLEGIAAQSGAVMRLGALQRMADARVVQRLTLPEKLNLDDATKRSVQNVFGPPRYNAVLNAAPSVATLKEWIVEMQGLHQAVAAARKPVDNPGLRGVTAAERAALDTATDARDARYQAMLAEGGGGGGGMALHGPGAAAAANVQADAPGDAAGDGPPADMGGLAIAEYEMGATPHGDFVSRGGSVTVRRAELRNYIDGNADLVFLGASGDYYEFREDLGDSANAEDGEWSLIVRYFPTTGYLRVTHFGPFGTATAAALAAGGGGGGGGGAM